MLTLFHHKENNIGIKSSATSHSDIQYIESLLTKRHYVMRRTKYELEYQTIKCFKEKKEKEKEKKNEFYPFGKNDISSTAGTQAILI